MRAGWLVVVLAGCVQSASVVCDDGMLCPAGATCLPTGGCRAASCGDGVVDGIAGEECDDANRLDHDGCSSTCRAETLQWTRAPGPDLRARQRFAAAWDGDRGRGLVHGGAGEGGILLGDTWVWNGTGWEQAPTPTGPTAVDEHAMAPDGSGRIVLVGGVASGVDQNQCWLWDGAWQACATPLPRGTESMEMAQDPAGGVLVTGGFFNPGGGLAFSPYTYHRAIDGTWTEPVTATLDNVYDHAVLLEAATGRVIRTGGSWSAGAEMTQIWTGTEWKAFGPPMNLQPIAAAYDPNRKRITAIGGGPYINPGDPTFPSHLVFELVDDDPDPPRWDMVTPQPPTQPDPPRLTAQPFYDPLRHAFVLFGGLDIHGTILGDTWLLSWHSDSPEEACDGTDNDADGLRGCDDPDCWPRCTPRSPPGAPRSDADPHCGDGVCNPALETAALCPDDC